MSGEVTNAELGRQIAALGTEIKDDIAGLRAELDRRVRVDVYDAQRQSVAEKLTTLVTTFDAFAKAVEERQKTTESDQRANRRMVWGAVIAAGLALVVQFITRSGAV
ncbi:hypothetical protein AB0I28_12670 [Phytomonospora sp. NPDC050363]|uniref:hypothetical protein n=1 Tax=Phytomonospora sp. NPDC050363 TaxID=3155642 RepID=UPI0033E755A9